MSTQVDSVHLSPFHRSTAQWRRDVLYSSNTSYDAKSSVHKRTRGCVECGQEFEINPCHARSHRFCRPACRARFHRRIRQAARDAA